MEKKYVCKNCGDDFKPKFKDPRLTPTFCSRSCAAKHYNNNQFKWKNLSESERFEENKKRFEEKVIKKDGCWDWKGNFCFGYTVLNSYHYCHRLSYEIYKGEIPHGLSVLHTCDNRKCTNPDHLWLGTYKDNSVDCKNKGRTSRGEKRHNSKLKNEDVIKIRELLALGVTGVRLAKQFNISYMTISNIKHKKIWTHIT